MTSPLDIWKHASLPVVAVKDWDSASAFLALAEIKRLRGQLAAAQALFTTLIEPVTGRDTRETLVRELGLTSADAAKAHRAASVVGRLPEAAALLAGGSISTEHLARLASITDDTDASDLLRDAVNESPDEFGQTVDRFRITKDAEGCRERAHNARTLKFFDTEFGVGFRGVLPAIPGGRFRTLVNQICDAHWRKAHPERAETLGGHNDEPRDRRMADALVQITGCGIVNPAASAAAAESTHQSESESAAGESQSHSPSEWAAGQSGGAERAGSDSSAEGESADGYDSPDDIGGEHPSIQRTEPHETTATATASPAPSPPSPPSPLSPLSPPSPAAIVVRTALIVTVNPETLEAAVLGRGPLPFDDAMALVDDPRTELYAAITSIDGAILKFGRSRRFASPLQKLAMAVRQHGRCAAKGCVATCERLDADHDPPYEDGGRTDIETMELFCPRHHAHRHATNAHHTKLAVAS